MINKERLKIITIILTLVVKTECDFFGELRMSIKILQDSVDQISLEQIRTNEKVDKLQSEVKSLSLDMTSRLETLDDLNEANKKTSSEQLRTNEKMDQLQDEVKSLSLDMTSRLETLDDLYEANNKTFEAINQLNIRMKNLTMETNEIAEEKGIILKNISS